MTPTMTCIVPLAGPDFLRPDGSLRPLETIEGAPLLETALTSRSWWRDGSLRAEGITFVLRDLPEAAPVRAFIAERFAGARIATVSDLTGGALLSALAGAALTVAPDAPLCVDLVDILYDGPDALLSRFDDPAVAGIIPWFTSDRPKYSYLEIVDGRVVRTAEKQVISTNASAGTYVFRDTPTFLDAAAWSLRHRAAVARNGVLFLCPSFNALAARNRTVLPVEVARVRSFS